MASRKPSSATPNIKDGPVHNISAKNGEGSDSSVSFKDDRLKENILNFENSRRTKESRGSCESGVSFKSDWSSDFSPDYRDRSPLKVISQVCSPARSRRPIPNIQVRSSQRGLLEDLLSPGISYASTKWDNSQGRFANVLETLPSPKKKSDFCNFEEEENKDTVADDKDLVESSDDQVSMKNGEDSDSSLSFKSDRSKDFIIDFKDRPSPSSQELSTSELEDNDHDEESGKSSDDEQNQTVLERGV